MSYQIYDMGIDDVFDTYEEAYDALMVEVSTYGCDFLEETYRSFFPWNDLWKWCLQQDKFFDEFGDTITAAEHEFADSCITEIESED